MGGCLDGSCHDLLAIFRRQILDRLLSGHSTGTSIYGAAGSVVTLLLWIYYSSLMFFFGAKLTQVYATRYGSKAIPWTQREALNRGTKDWISTRFSESNWAIDTEKPPKMFAEA